MFFFMNKKINAPFIRGSADIRTFPPLSDGRKQGGRKGSRPLKSVFFFRKVLGWGPLFDLQSVTFWSAKNSIFPKCTEFDQNFRTPRKSCAENLIFGRPAMNHSFFARNFFFYSASKSTKNAIEIWEISKVSLFGGVFTTYRLKKTLISTLEVQYLDHQRSDWTHVFKPQWSFII